MNRSHPTLRQRVAILRWALPIIFVLMAVAYQLGVARWVHDHYTEFLHYGIEILFYGTAGPLLAFWVLTLVGRWLDEKEHAEKLVRVTERRLVAITTASADAILSLDKTGHIESWNRGAELLFGFTADQIRGKPLSDLLGGSEAVKVEFNWMAEVVQNAGFIRGYETTVRDAAGVEIDVELTATLLTDETGNSIGMSVILRDITSRKRRDEEISRLNLSLNEQVAERTRQLAEKVEALARANADLQKIDQMRSEFVSLVTHQIRAPLTNLRGAAERMQNDCGAMTWTCSRMFNVLEQQITRLDRLVQDVLNADRLEAGELVLQTEPVSILPLVEQVVEQLRSRTNNRRFLLPNKPGLPLVWADRDRLSEVLANLLDNADKYSQPGREIIVDVRADETDVTVSVRDHGPGVPEGDLERVFDKFYRTDNSDSQVAYGYGLGLYICRMLVEAHRGHIWVENAPEGGAIFSFTLPLAR